MLFDDDLTQKQQSWYPLALIKPYCKQGDASHFRYPKANTLTSTLKSSK